MVSSFMLLNLTMYSTSGVFIFSGGGIVKSVHSAILIAIIGWLMGYINEEKARGSILPGWGIHAITVIYAGICTAFSLHYY